MKPTLYITELTQLNDDFLQKCRDNFIELDKFIKREPFLNGEFRHYELTFSAAVTNQTFQHHLSFVPKDIIQTFLTPGVTLTWAYTSFDRTNIQFTTDGACTVRFFVGRYTDEAGAR